MALPGSLKLKCGPFWLNTSILLVNVVSLGSCSATFVLRVERPAVCGGCIDLPIGRLDYPIALLPRSEDDRQNLSFRIRYGEKGKVFRFYTASPAVYANCIAVLLEALKRGAKRAKRGVKRASRVRSKTEMDCTAASGGGKLQHQRRRAKTSCQRHPTHCVPESNSVLVASRYTKHKDEYGGSIDSVSPSLATAAQPIGVGFAVEQQNVYCVAQDQDGATTFSVYVPARSNRHNQSWRAGRVFNLSFEKWIQWLTNDARDTDSQPEIFLLTGSSCERLKLSEMLAFMRP